MPHDFSLTRTVQDVPYLALPRLRLPGETGGAVNNPDDLPDGWWERAESIAGTCARNWFGAEAGTDPLSYLDRRDAALDGIVTEVLDNGWLAAAEPAKRLFRAATNAIERATREQSKHVRHWAFWYDAPGQADAIGEAVTDKLGVRQLCRAFTEGEWSAVWAYAEVQKWGGGQADAAALLGLPYPVFHARLSNARKRARGLWVAPGDTPPPKQWVQVPGKRGEARNTRRANWADGRRRSGQRADRRADLAAAVMSGTAEVADVPMLAALTGGYVKEHSIRRWIRDGLLPQRGMVHNRLAYSVDEFVKVAIDQGRIGNDPREKAA